MVAMLKDSHDDGGDGNGGDVGDCHDGGGDGNDDDAWW